jgi:hypothetical protein
MTSSGFSGRGAILLHIMERLSEDPRTILSAAARVAND